MKWTRKLLTAVSLILMLCSTTICASNNVSEIDIDVTVRDDGSAYIVQNWRGTFDEGTCGAVTGALIANGLVIDDPSKIKQNAKEIFNAFKDEYGTVRCDKISDSGNDKSPCVDCCVFIAKKVAELWDE